MARYPQAEIEQLKNEVSVERLVESAGIALKKSGKDRLGLCPFHDDAEPSLVVTPAKNLWHCFGCQIGGGPIDWVMKSRGVSFRHAVELLKADPALAAHGTDEPQIKRATARSLPAPVAYDADDQDLLNQTIGYYHETLTQSPEALAYLKARGLDHPELAARFKLGYANRTLGLRLPEKRRIAGFDIRTRLQKVGIYRESGHEHFNGSLVVPVIDAAGNVLEAYGRKIRDDLRKGTPAHLYLPGPHRGVWNEAALAGATEVILCEALIDAMTFWCAGFTNVTAAYGVEGFTADHLAALRRNGTRRVLIAYDRDDAGDRAADKLALELIAEGIECLRVRFPRGMDANAYALKLTPAHQSLGLVLRQAEWIGRAPVPDAQPVSANAVVPAPAAAVPLAAATLDAPVPPDATGDELLVVQGDRHWRVRGWKKNLSPEQMRVNLQVRRAVEGGGGGALENYHVDTLDLYAARSRAAYIKQAAIELGLPDEVVKRDLGNVLLRLEMLQDEAIREHAQPKSRAPMLSADEELAALELLKAPDLLARIVADMERCGVVGEANNLLAGYLAAVSRKLDTPLAILIQSSSAAGKSSLMDAVLAMVPPEERVQYSAMTGQSLFYLGETDMQHKILAIAEEEGVRQAAYALKLLQSDGELTMASTGKDEASGNLVTKQYRVKGPVMLMLTTTAIDVDEELMNRCMVLSVNESREQTRAIHARQRMKQTLAGLLAANDRQAITQLHQNAQRLLEPVLVVNPYADRLTFLDDKTRMRRDHVKYLTLIRAIALLHQHQREVKTVEHRGQRLAYIEATRDDVALANTIVHDVLGRTLDDLPPQTRRLLSLVRDMVGELAQVQGVAAREVRFTRRDVRAATHWSDGQLKIHCARLTEMEYLLVHGGGRGHHLQYELLYDGAGDGRQLSGLIDPAQLDEGHGYDARKSGGNERKSGPSRPQVRARSGPAKPCFHGRGEGAGRLAGENTLLRERRPRRRNGGLIMRTGARSRDPGRPRFGKQVGDPRDARGLYAAMRRFIEHRGVLGGTESSLYNLERYIRDFIGWADERAVTHPEHVTQAVLERYQRWLYHYRKANGAPLSVASRRGKLVPLRVFFKWLTRTGQIPANPAAELDLPRQIRRLPRHVLSALEVERVLAGADTGGPIGLRDRAMMEVLYATGMRRMEISRLEIGDVDVDKCVVLIREGKGRKDRLIPLGERALHWVQEYLDKSRPQLMWNQQDLTLFLGNEGHALSPMWLSTIIARYVDKADIGKHGGCHLFRHTMATLMLEGGADIRFIQAMLGHAELSTTQIYAQVAIRQLLLVHATTHPGALRRVRGREENSDGTAVRPSSGPGLQAGVRAASAPEVADGANPQATDENGVAALLAALDAENDGDGDDDMP